MRTLLPCLLAAGALLSGCSESTEDNAEVLAERAAADAEANFETAKDAVRVGTAKAADAVSEGAENLSEELKEDHATDPEHGDGQLDGTD